MNKLDKLFRVFYSKGGHVERAEILLACNYLNNNGVVAIPTDTLYGVAARIDRPEALEKIYKIKGRDPAKPLAVCLAGFEQLDQVADVSKHHRDVLKLLLPGPLTIVLNRSASLSKDLNPGTQNVGIRIPDHNFSRAISDMLDCPLALTSANKSGQPSPLRVEDFQDIWEDLDAIFDAGPMTPNRLRNGSTVIDMTEEKAYKILREGCGLNRTINVLNRIGYKRKR